MPVGATLKPWIPTPRIRALTSSDLLTEDPTTYLGALTSALVSYRLGRQDLPFLDSLTIKVVFLEILANLAATSDASPHELIRQGHLVVANRISDGSCSNLADRFAQDHLGGLPSFTVGSTSTDTPPGTFRRFLSRPTPEDLFLPWRPGFRAHPWEHAYRDPVTGLHFTYPERKEEWRSVYPHRSKLLIDHAGRIIPFKYRGRFGVILIETGEKFPEPLILYAGEPTPAEAPDGKGGTTTFIYLLEGGNPPILRRHRLVKGKGGESFARAYVIAADLNGEKLAPISAVHSDHSFICSVDAVGIPRAVIAVIWAGSGVGPTVSFQHGEKQTSCRLPDAVKTAASCITPEFAHALSLERDQILNLLERLVGSLDALELLQHTRLVGTQGTDLRLSAVVAKLRENEMPATPGVVSRRMNASRRLDSLKLRASA